MKICNDKLNYGQILYGEWDIHLPAKDQPQQKNKPKYGAFLSLYIFFFIIRNIKPNLKHFLKPV